MLIPATVTRQQGNIIYTSAADMLNVPMQCAALDRQIDAAVYELYGLTEEEIKIVEGKEKS